jgi:PAS domain S-box-containing protein
MMPKMDGFGLLRALESDATTRTTPLILLSARAGEEARSEGIDAGADDYLVKPFTARELLAHVGARIRQVRLHKAESGLRESLERYRLVFEQAADGIWLADQEGRFIDVNPAACVMPGYSREEHLQLTIGDIVCSGENGPLTSDLKGQISADHPVPNTWKFRRADGAYIQVELSHASTPDGLWQAIGRDITARQRAQEEALFRQKLESLGTLAGGIAHDFNNLLGAIQAQADLGLAEIDSGSSGAEELKAIGEVAMRGAEIVRQLMIYSGKESTLGVELVDLSKIVDEMLALLKVSVTKRALIEVNLDHHLPAIPACAGDLRRIVMNLISNASDAIDEEDGVIRVVTRRVTLAAVSAPFSPTGVAKREYVELKVSDTGRGMSAETQAKAFDPFFTTKCAGRGLGLAVVQGIVRDLGGLIRLTSETGKGTSIEVLLPGEETTTSTSHLATSDAAETADAFRRGVVLVVEDEDSLRQAVVKMLRKAGLDAFEAADGSSAIDLLRSDAERIDLILLDMTIPGASSQEVVAKAASANPNIAVILTSAYSQETFTDAMSQRQIRGFVRKPFQFAHLLSAIRSSLPSERIAGRRAVTDA